MKSRIWNLIENYKYTRILITAFIFLIGFAARFVLLGSIPNGLNQDEAYAGYEAYSLLNYGVDSWGYSFPVYLTAWGSGMSVMNSYLMIPFIALFGTNPFAIRLPQAVLGLVTLLYFYKLFKNFYPNDDLIPVIALFILSINPWHILMCRWALDCNMASAFCLIAFYYFCRGVDEPKYYIPSALFYGLTLYCYALTWILIPIFVLLQGIYLIITKKFKFSVYLILAVAIFAVLAFPLLLFTMVNQGKIAELSIGLISIPKMPLFRSTEIAIGHRKARLLGFIGSIIQQDDGYIWNYAGKYGLYYTCGLVLSIIGLLDIIVLSFKSVFKRMYRTEVMLIIPIGVCIIFSSLLDANFSKMNLFHIPMIALSIVGVKCLLGLLRVKSIKMALTLAACIVFFITFISFEKYYFGTYSHEIAYNFKSGLSECLSYADSVTRDSTIYVCDYAAHPNVLFYEKIPVTDEGLRLSRNGEMTSFSFSRYSFDSNDVSEGDICILAESGLPDWYSEEKMLYQNGIYIVAER